IAMNSQTPHHIYVGQSTEDALAALQHSGSYDCSHRMGSFRYVASKDETKKYRSTYYRIPGDRIVSITFLTDLTTNQGTVHSMEVQNDLSTISQTWESSESLEVPGSLWGFIPMRWR